MILKYYNSLKLNENVRENLSKLRSQIKNEAEREQLLDLVEDGDILMDLLCHEDAKTRKNVALLLGDLEFNAAKKALISAYEKETTRFVKSAYLIALSKLPVKEYRDFFVAQRDALLGAEWAEEEQKHIAEELHELYGILLTIDGVQKHPFVGFDKPNEILLATNREQREVTLQEVAELSATIQRKAELHPLGVSVYTKEILPFTKLRSYRELLFPLCKGEVLPVLPREAAKALLDGGMLSLLQEGHNGDAPFYFRVEIKAPRPQMEYAKKLSTTLEQMSRFKLVNAAKDYEVELRLVQTKDETYIAFLKLKTIPMKRFLYRKNAISMSIHPAAAAMMMRLAKPYLKEQAQILDPCCGVGTMLIERDLCVPAREMYGIDIFGDAITGARENASLAGEKINFIHRDFFDFKHEYLFDEIITNMPVRGRKTKEEADLFYEQFFKKAKTLLTPDGKIIMYTNESGFVKKQLRLQSDLRLVQEFCIRKKEGFFLYIITKR